MQIQISWYTYTCSYSVVAQGKPYIMITTITTCSYINIACKFYFRKMPTINWSKINEKRGEAEAEKWKGRHR